MNTQSTETQVRHRDIVELLAKANIGSSGHHIISQGEADRVLHASNEERKEMLEDGLGLKLLQYRRAEAEKKLQRAQVNITETDLLLRETAPHLRHLKRQVDRYEKAKKVRKDLTTLYIKYLAYEGKYLTTTRCNLENRHDTLAYKLAAIEKEVNRERKKTAVQHTPEEFNAEEQELTKKIHTLQNKKDLTSREIGRLEGECTAIETLTHTAEETVIDRKVLSRLYTEVKRRHRKTEDSYTTLITYILEQLEQILGRNAKTRPKPAEKRLHALQKEQEKVREQLTTLKKQEEQYICTQEALRKNREKEMVVVRQSEKNLLLLMTEKSTIAQEVSEVRHTLAVLQENEKDMKQELAEGAVLIGSAVNKYKEVIVPREIESENRTKQKERKKTLERKKIELEAMDAGGGEDVCKEYTEVSERVTFLQKEKKDLLDSIRDCQEGIQTIEKEVNARFKTGIQAISKEFERVFQNSIQCAGRRQLLLRKILLKKKMKNPRFV